MSIRTGERERERFLSDCNPLLVNHSVVCLVLSKLSELANNDPVHSTYYYFSILIVVTSTLVLSSEYHMS